MAATDVVDNQSQAQSGKSPNDSKEASPSKKTEETTSDQKAQALMALVNGKRHMLCQDIPAAVSSLGEACELLSVEYGEKAPECAEAYFYYGKSLLEMARLESGVLGNALDGVPEGDDTDTSNVEDPEKMTEEERTDVEEKVDGALEENFETCEKSAEKKAKSTDGASTSKDKMDGKAGNIKENGVDKKGGDVNGTKDGESEKSEEQEDEEMEGEESPEDGEEGGEPEKDAEQAETDSVEGEKKEGEDAAAQEAEDEDDPSNLQLAWEMLELAKVVFKEQLEGEKKAALTAEVKASVEKKLCETFLTLGEVSLENENYVQAVEDLTLCLDRQQASLPVDARPIAETHYQLGVALGFHMKYEEAIVSLEAAITVLNKRISNLKEKTESPDETKKDDPFYTREKEIAEIEALVPEIKEKIADTQEMKDESIRKVAEMKEQMGFGSSSSCISNGAGSSSASTSTAKPISTISIKRKNENETGEESKKMKASNEDIKDNTAETEVAKKDESAA